MNFYDAVWRTLVERGLPVVVEYELFSILRSLHFKGDYKGRKLRLAHSAPTRDRYRNVVSKLLSERYLRPDPDFYPSEEWGRYDRGYNYARVFRISDVPDGSAEDITAILDPFCYISHMSAMQRYSLTNRIPEALILSTPRNWGVARDEKIHADYGDSLSPGEYIAPLSQLTWPDMIRRRKVVLNKTVRKPNIKNIRGSIARIAAVGETFVQALDRPELCGGMEHTIEVWENHANTYLDEIIVAVDQAKESIIKVRAGYLLNERLGIHDHRILAWAAFAQRGGSRKLDASAPYVPTFSEKWMISLNAG